MLLLLRRPHARTALQRTLRRASNLWRNYEGGGGGGGGEDYGTSERTRTQ